MKEKREEKRGRVRNINVKKENVREREKGIWASQKSDWPALLSNT